MSRKRTLDKEVKQEVDVSVVAKKINLEPGSKPEPETLASSGKFEVKDEPKEDVAPEQKPVETRQARAARERREKTIKERFGGPEGFREHMRISEERSKEEEPIRALQKRSSDRIQRDSREYELFSSLARWMKRTHPALRNHEFATKPAASECWITTHKASTLITFSGRRATVARLLEYLSWRVQISKQFDPHTQMPILNPKTGKFSQLSTYSLVVLSMKLYELVRIGPRFQ